MNSETGLNKSELLDWILSANISIQWEYPMTWTNQDGSTFKTNWLIDSPTIRFATYPTIEESLQEAYKTWTYVNSLGLS